MQTGEMSSATVSGTGPTGLRKGRIFLIENSSGRDRGLWGKITWFSVGRSLAALAGILYLVRLLLPELSLS